jgi:hypothetical protein
MDSAQHGVAKKWFSPFRGSTGEDENYFLVHIQAPSLAPGCTAIMA